MWQVSWENISIHSSFIQNLITPRTMPRSKEVILMSLRLERRWGQHPCSMSALPHSRAEIYPSIQLCLPHLHHHLLPRLLWEVPVYLWALVFTGWHILPSMCQPFRFTSQTPAQASPFLSPAKRLHHPCSFGFPGSRRPHPLLVAMFRCPLVTAPAWRLWRTELDLRHPWSSTWAHRLTQSPQLVHMELSW